LNVLFDLMGSRSDVCNKLLLVDTINRKYEEQNARPVC